VESRRQGTTLFTAILVLISTLVVIQLWIVSAGVQALLGGSTDVLVPAAVASLVLLLGNSGLLLYILSFDRRIRRVNPRA
jgi:F0F1-type ATP synthase assembly protein I